MTEATVPVVTLTREPVLGCWVLRHRAPGPAGAHVLRTDLGVVVRTDVAQPFVVLDAALVAEPDGNTSDDALEIVELLFGPSARDLLVARQEGTVALEVKPGPARGALLALVARDPADAEGLAAAEAVLNANQASTALGGWARPLAERAADALAALPADASVALESSAAAPALSRLAAALRAALGPDAELGMLAQFGASRHDVVPELDPDTFAAMWDGLTARSDPDLASTARGPRRAVVADSAADDDWHELDVAGMGLPAGLLGGGGVRVRKDLRQETVAVRAPLGPAGLVVPVWLRVFDDDEIVTCQVAGEARDGELWGEAVVAAERLDRAHVELTCDPAAEPRVPARRRLEQAEAEGRAARDLLDALAARPASAQPKHWHQAAARWERCADLWARAEPPEGDRAALAHALAAACWRQGGLDGDARRNERRIVKLREAGALGWADSHLDIGDDPAASPGLNLVEVARPVLDSLVVDHLGRLPGSRSLEDAASLLLRLARLGGTSPPVRAARGRAGLDLALLAFQVGRVDLADSLATRAATDLLEGHVHPSDPAWGRLAILRADLDAPDEGEDTG